MQFYRAEPTPRTSWRMAVLMGANSRTYKFALAEALLTLADEGRDTATLGELAVPYSLAMARHARMSPQGPLGSRRSDLDFLAVLDQESEQTLAMNAPTEALVIAAVASIPGMVATKFHNVFGGEVQHRFYDIRGTGPSASVVLTRDVQQVAMGENRARLDDELVARWSLVETCFDPEVGTSLRGHGLLLSPDSDFLLDRIRRAPVAHARSALSGFQHGRCFYCHELLDDHVDVPHVDHVYPYSLMTKGSWQGPELNGVWNLVVACSACNLAKSDRWPTPSQVEQLIERNVAVIQSPHPLKKTIQVLTGAADLATMQMFFAHLDAYVARGY
jgi:5-methylcytosine-specific restriction endonuclease McrA